MSAAPRYRLNAHDKKALAAVKKHRDRAAAINYVKWLRRLPEHRAPIDVGDMAEAAQMLAVDPDHTKLNNLEWERVVVKLATELKIKREGLDSRDLPPRSRNHESARARKR